MNISARDIQAFLALAEVKNFTRAAARCHLSQPAFSALIKALEDHVGLKLFDRSTRHVLLTQEGERFWLSAQRIAEELEDCAKAMRDTAQLARGHVAVALLPSLAAGWLPGVLAQFLARHPGVEVAVQDVLSEPCITAVAQGRRTLPWRRSAPTRPSCRRSRFAAIASTWCAATTTRWRSRPRSACRICSPGRLCTWLGTAACASTWMRRCFPRPCAPWSRWSNWPR